jgi:uncharacterized protein YggE
MPRFRFHFAPALLVGTLVLFAGPAFAESPPSRTMTVSGEGEIRAIPDEAQLSAGVVTQAHNAADALAENSRRMNAVFDALKHLGIPDKSIQTSDFSVSPQYQTDQHGNTTLKVIGYQVSNNVNVTVDDLGKLGPAVDALVSTGANNMGGISFTIRDTKPLLDQARAAAVKDALGRAKIYSKSAGVTLGPIMSIGENGYETPRPMFRAMTAMAVNSIAAPTPVAAGEDRITANVSITFEIR